MARRILASILGVVLGLVATLMLISPETWYRLQPGVAAHGPFNSHFVRDIGCANLLAGVALVLVGFGVSSSRTLLAVATAFLTLHAFIHLGEWAVGHPPTGAADFLSVYGPPLICLALLATDLSAKRQASCLLLRTLRSCCGSAWCPCLC